MRKPCGARRLLEQGLHVAHCSELVEEAEEGLARLVRHRLDAAIDAVEHEGVGKLVVLLDRSELKQPLGREAL